MKGIIRFKDYPNNTTVSVLSREKEAKKSRSSNVQESPHNTLQLRQKSRSSTHLDSMVTADSTSESCSRTERTSFPYQSTPISSLNNKTPLRRIDSDESSAPFIDITTPGDLKVSKSLEYLNELIQISPRPSLMMMPSDDRYRENRNQVNMGRIEEFCGGRKLIIQQLKCLSALYDHTNGETWARNKHWCTASDTVDDDPDEDDHHSQDSSISLHFSDWQGIEVDEYGNIVELRLLMNNIRGSIPPDFCHLKSLTKLDLANNQIGGSLPEEISGLSSLIELKLHYNELSGSLPESIVQLQQLRNLHLSGNHLTGPIPPSIGRIKELRKLNIACNHLSGCIPSSIGDLIHLRELKLNDNRLSGEIPQTFSKLRELRILFLNGNKLTGSVPPFLSLLPDLEKLNLSDNPLTGTLPKSFIYCAKLSDFKIKNTKILGPTSVSKLRGRMPWLCKMVCAVACAVGVICVGAVLVMARMDGLYDMSVASNGSVLQPILYLQHVYLRVIPMPRNRSIPISTSREDESGISIHRSGSTHSGITALRSLSSRILYLDSKLWPDFWKTVHHVCEWISFRLLQGAPVPTREEIKDFDPLDEVLVVIRNFLVSDCDIPLTSLTYTNDYSWISMDDQFDNSDDTRMQCSEQSIGCRRVDAVDVLVRTLGVRRVKDLYHLTADDLVKYLKNHLPVIQHRKLVMCICHAHQQDVEAMTLPSSPSHGISAGNLPMKLTLCDT